MSAPTVVVAGLGDTGLLVATRLARHCRVIAVSTRDALVSGQELGIRLTDPQRWGRHYFVPFSRFRRLDQVEVRHGKVVAINLDASTVRVEARDATIESLHYDVLVIATGVSNGFWRHDRVEDADATAREIDDQVRQLAEARTVAVVGGGATGVAVADNLARHGSADVHLFHPGDAVLPQHHPAVRKWAERTLRRDGVIVHPDRRAVLPGGIAPDRITAGPIEWVDGRAPFEADAVVWTVGAVRPHSAFLPADALDEAGFVQVDHHLRVQGRANVFAVGDVAASDPLRSSARNWGHRVVVGNVRRRLRGKEPVARFRAPQYRWGSVFGLQSGGLTVVSAHGRRVRVPRLVAEPLLYGVVVARVLYGGLRPPVHRRRPAD